MGIQLRSAVLGDLKMMHAIRRDAILGIDSSWGPSARETWANRRSADYYAERVANGDVVIACLDGDDVAWGSSSADVVTGLYVRSLSRALGVGRALLSELESMVAARGHASARLESSPNAVVFYEKLGYVRAGVSQADEGLPMSKRLRPASGGSARDRGRNR